VKREKETLKDDDHTDDYEIVKEETGMIE